MATTRSCNSVRLFSTYHCSLKAQARFTHVQGQPCKNSAMEYKSTAIKNYRFNILRESAFCELCSDFFEDSTFFVFKSASRVEYATRVLPVASSTICAYMCLPLRSTAKRGRSAVPSTFLRMRALFFKRLFVLNEVLFFNLMRIWFFTFTYFAADLPALRRIVSSAYLTPLPNTAQADGNRRILAATSANLFTIRSSYRNLRLLINSDLDSTGIIKTTG